jgi:hypothetical protein
MQKRLLHMTMVIVLGCWTVMLRADPAAETVPPEDPRPEVAPAQPPAAVPPATPGPQRSITPVRPRMVPVRPPLRKPQASTPALKPAPAPENVFTGRDWELRRAAADRLAALGYRQPWEIMTLEELVEKENRIQTAERLRKRGVDVTWTTNSLSALAEIEKRLIRADRLLMMGKAVDWKTHTAEQMAQMEVDLCQRQARH